MGPIYIYIYIYVSLRAKLCMRILRPRRRPVRMSTHVNVFIGKLAHKHSHVFSNLTRLRLFVCAAIDWQIIASLSFGTI